MIAVLAARPLRRHSLATLKVSSLALVGREYVLSIDGIATKSGHAIAFPLPESLTNYLHRYLAHVRQCFPGYDQHDELWPSTKGRSLGEEAIYDLICRRTQRHFGFAIHPHLFRDIAASAIARDTPGSMLIARDLLTHASITTTSRHYMQADTLHAARQHGAAIEALRSTVHTLDKAER